MSFKPGGTFQVDFVAFFYYNSPANQAVDPSIRAGRLLTGADFDIESFRRDRYGNYWFGDEFGPYLIETDPQGTVLRSEISMPGVFAPENKDVVAGRALANLPSSGGFEGMAINRNGTKLYTLLERTVAGDPAKTLRIDEFDITTELARASTGMRLAIPGCWRSATSYARTRYGTRNSAPHPSDSVVDRRAADLAS
jgi:hypothetical protein